MAVAADNQQAALMALSAVNNISRVGGSDTTVSGNATVTLLITAILALGFQQGAGNPDTNIAVARGLRIGTLSGVLSETHSQTTIAGLASTIVSTGGLNVATTYDGFLPQ